MKQERKNNNHTTIIKQSYNNEKQWNAPTKHDNETQQWKNNSTTMKTTMKHKNEKTIEQQSYNNRNSMKHANETRKL